MKRVDLNNSYLKGRSLSEETLADKRFLVLQEGVWKNISFIHYNFDDEICGYEQKNKDFTFFSKGGEKGIWRSNNLTLAKTIVICESAIDALSHAELKETGSDVAYISFCGQMSHEQLAIIQKVTQGKSVIIATDNDKAGDIFAEKINNLLQGNVISILREKPSSKDWNDDLREEQEESLERTRHTF